MIKLESEEQETQFWKALKTKKLPLKFFYAGPSAFMFDKDAKQSAYQEVAGPTGIELEGLTAFGRTNKRIAGLCEIGPGNAFHSISFIEQCLKNGIELKRYLGIDFSKTLLKICVGRLSDRFPSLRITSAQWDFEESATAAVNRWRKKDKILIAMLGGTLGNPEDPNNVLRNLFNSCLKGDAFLLGVALMRKGVDFLQRYQTGTFREAILTPLTEAGLKTKGGEFKLSFENNTVFGDFIVGENMTLYYQGESICFNTGERVRCFRSKRFNDSEVKQLLSDAGWEILNSVYDEDYTHGIYLSHRR